MSGLVRDPDIDNKEPVILDLYLFLVLFPPELFHLRLNGERALCGAVNINEAVLHLFHAGCAVPSGTLQSHRSSGHPEGILEFPFLQLLQVLFFQYLCIFLSFPVAGLYEDLPCRCFCIDRKEAGAVRRSPVAGEVLVFHGEGIVRILFKSVHRKCPCAAIPVPLRCADGVYG